jgi:hypothetical protein
LAADVRHGREVLVGSSDQVRAWGLLLPCLAIALSDCSLLIHVDDNQCQQDVDCTRLGLGTSCQRGVCVTNTDGHCDAGICSVVGNAIATTCNDDSQCGSGDDRTCWNAQCFERADVQQFQCDVSAPAANEVQFKLPIRELASQKAPSGLFVSACRVLDPSCNHIAASYFDADGSGQVSLILPNDFIGFLEIHSDRNLTTLYYLTRPPAPDTTANTLYLYSSDTLAMLGEMLGTSVDSSAGVALLDVLDCNGKPVGGIDLVASTKTTAFYFVDGAPSHDGDTTSLSDAGNSGLAGFLNAPPGSISFSARLGADGPVIAKFNANVRANTLTYIDIRP